MAADAVLLDTNVLIYATRPASRQAQALAAVQRLENQGSSLWVSRQILREYLAAVTRPQATAPALPIATAVSDVRLFVQRFYVAEDSPDVMASLLDLLERFPTSGRQVHDANIVATMLAHGIPRLLTFNMADLRRFASVVALEPTEP